MIWRIDKIGVIQTNLENMKRTIVLRFYLPLTQNC